MYVLYILIYECKVSYAKCDIDLLARYLSFWRDICLLAGLLSRHVYNRVCARTRLSKPYSYVRGRQKYANVCVCKQLSKVWSNVHVCKTNLNVRVRKKNVNVCVCKQLSNSYANVHLFKRTVCVCKQLSNSYANVHLFKRTVCVCKQLAKPHLAFDARQKASNNTCV